MVSLDQHELLNQIINHKMLQKILEAECNKTKEDYHIFTRIQMSEIVQKEFTTNTDLVLRAMDAQIAEEEEMFRCTR